MDNASEFRAHRARVEAVAEDLHGHGYAVRRYTWWQRQGDGTWVTIPTREVHELVYKGLDTLYPDWYRSPTGRYNFYRQVADLLRVPIGQVWPPS